MNIFEEGTKQKLRFTTEKGNITIEDLWDIPLVGSVVCLDVIATQLHRAVKDSEEESFVKKRSTANKTLELKFEIVKHIIKVKLDTIDNKENAAVVKAKKDKIDEIIAGKEDDALAGKSISELKKMKSKL